MSKILNDENTHVLFLVVLKNAVIFTNEWIRRTCVKLFVEMSLT